MRKLVAVLFVLITSCSKSSEEEQSDYLLGIWSRSIILDDSSFEQIVKYEFADDTTFEWSQQVSDKQTKKLIGYTSATFGNYRVDGNRLIFDNIIISYNDNPDFFSSSINELEVSSGSGNYSVTFELDKRRKVLTLYQDPCAPNELCAFWGSETFIRD